MTEQDRADGPTARAAVDDVLRWLATRDLASTTPILTRSQHRNGRIPPGESADSAQLIAAAESQRMLGPLVDAAMAGEIELSDEHVERLHERHAAVMAWCVLIEVRLLEVRQWFDAAGGVEHRVIKGSAVAHLDEVDPAMRSFADLDLLVAADDLDRAVRTLERKGAARPWPERRPGFDRRFAKSVTLTYPDGIEIDLHRTLCDGVHGARIPLDELFGTSDRFDIGGDQVPALTAPHRMLHAAYHAVLGSPMPRLLSLRDLAHYMSRPDLSTDVVVPIARAWRGESVLAAAIDVTTATLDVDAPDWATWRATAITNHHEQELIERQRREGSSFGRGKFAVLGELPDIRTKAAYATAVVWPTSTHLRARGLRRSDLLRSLVGRSPGDGG